MKSNVCIIDNGTKDLAAILSESERIAEYNGLTHKQALQLRLICEELDGMLPYMIDEFKGTIWIEYEEGLCKVTASIKVPDFDADKRGMLIGLAKNRKNAAAVGIVGKIRNALENFFLSEEGARAFDAAADGYGAALEYGDDYTYLWSLEQYRSSVKQEKQSEAWDGLEKSVLASVADDVIVGVKGKQADIVIVKKFA